MYLYTCCNEMHTFRKFSQKEKKTETIIIPLYKTFVRPHLEYNSIIWSPSTKMNENIIEKCKRDSIFDFIKEMIKKNLKKRL